MTGSREARKDEPRGSGPPAKGPYDPDAIRERVEREARLRADPAVSRSDEPPVQVDNRNHPASAVSRSDEPRNALIVAAASVLRDWLPEVGSTDRAHISEAIADAALAASIPSPSSEDGLLRCPECDHPESEHATPGGECVHAFCTHDQSFELVRAALSTPPAPAPEIDVERLTRAYGAVWHSEGRPLGWPPLLAGRIAAEYRRLSDPKDAT